MSDVTVYFHNGPHGARIGPPGAWSKGDDVQVPPRGPKFGDEGLPGFAGRVTEVLPDGLAQVVNVLSLAEDAAA